MSSSIPVLPGADESSAPSPAGPVPDPAARPVRRTFTAEYRARVVAEYEAAPHGGKAAVQRREGLYQSQVREWTAARDALTARDPAPRRAHRATADRRQDDPARLRDENERLTRELAQSQAVVAIMGRLQELLETISESSATNPPSRTVLAGRRDMRTARLSRGRLSHERSGTRHGRPTPEHVRAGVVVRSCILPSGPR